jgi:hypothetical protein
MALLEHQYIEDAPFAEQRCHEKDDYLHRDLIVRSTTLRPEA